MKINSILLILIVLISCKKDEKKTYIISGNVYSKCPGLPDSYPRQNFHIGLKRGQSAGLVYIETMNTDQNGYFEFEYEKDGDEKLYLGSIFSFGLPVLVDIPANQNHRNLVVQSGSIRIPISFKLEGVDKYDASDTLRILNRGTVRSFVPGPFTNGSLINLDHYETWPTFHGSIYQFTYKMSSEQNDRSVEVKIPDYCSKSNEVNLTFD